MFCTGAPSHGPHSAEFSTALITRPATYSASNTPTQEAPDAIVVIDVKNGKISDSSLIKKIDEPGRLKDMLKEKQLVRKGICASLEQVSQGMCVFYFVLIYLYSRVGR